MFYVRGHFVPGNNNSIFIYPVFWQINWTARNTSAQLIVWMKHLTDSKCIREKEWKESSRILPHDVCWMVNIWYIAEGTFYFVGRKFSWIASGRTYYYIIAFFWLKKGRTEGAPFDSNINVFCLFQLNQIQHVICIFFWTWADQINVTGHFVSLPFKIKHQNIIQLYISFKMNQKSRRKICFILKPKTIRGVKWTNISNCWKLTHLISTETAKWI